MIDSIEYPGLAGPAKKKHPDTKEEVKKCRCGRIATYKCPTCGLDLCDGQYCRADHNIKEHSSLWMNKKF